MNSQIINESYNIRSSISLPMMIYYEQFIFLQKDFYLYSTCKVSYTLYGHDKGNNNKNLYDHGQADNYRTNVQCITRVVLSQELIVHDTVWRGQLKS